MTVSVTLRDGTSEIYVLFGDACVKHSDGTLDIIRGGAKGSYTYARGEWTDVQGDEKRWRRTRFWGLRQTGALLLRPRYVQWPASPCWSPGLGRRATVA